MPFPTRVRVLAKVDESTLASGVRGNLGHPGHGGDQYVVRHLLGGVKSVMGMAPFCR
ncbi:hypothetical protein [Nonomuraea jabiensis]|uniref:hypothetical protein n=1 Tax=Nonomuraea jabiensis TaxID=882448 RepID=UPI00368C3230